MQLLRNFAKATVIALVLLMASVTMMAMPIQAQTQYTNMQDGGSIPLPAGVTPDVTFDTIAHLSFRPNPIGLGQPLLVNLWIQPPIHVTHFFKDAYTVKFTKPDGTTESVGPLTGYKGDTSAWFEEIIDQVGTWKIEFDFIGGYYPAGNYTMIAGTFSTQQGQDTIINFPQSVYYAPSKDGPYEFEAQQDFVGSWPASPLPTDYWSRPISPENREWWQIAGGYPATGIEGGGPIWPADTNRYMSNYKYTPYVQAPNSAHIVWKQQGDISGLIGGTLGQISLYTGPGNPTIIYAGRCYQTITKIIEGTATRVWECYDLRTGQVYWDRTDVSQIPTMLSYRERTVEMVPGEEASKTGLSVTLLYVGGGRLLEYDPWLGELQNNMSIAPLSSATLYASPEIFLSIQNLGGGKGYRLINWTVAGYLAHHSGYAEPLYVDVLNNITWPFSSLGTVDYESMVAVTTQSIQSTSAGGTESQGSISYSYRLIGVSMLTGEILWNTTTSEPFGGFFSGSTACADHGKYAVRLNDGHWHCWDLQTGRELWTSELSSWPWGTFGIYGVSSYGGLLIYPQYDGVVAYNWTNGKIAWRYEYEAQYPYETVFGSDYPFYDSAIVIADGKLYTSNTEHSPSNPITRGQKLHCINVTTGEGIWNITGSMSAGAVADGYLTASNRYDGYMYVFGKGLSATAASASPATISKGSQVLITGTVMDISPAQTNTPCVSHDSMATQMEYLHMQHPMDGVGHDVQMTGVPVTLTAIAEDGSTLDIGTATTSAYYGTFEMAWTPPAEGTYKIIASFAGDDSYGSSGASTAVSVGPAIVTPEIPLTVVPDYTMTIVYAAIAIIIAVVIAFALATLLILRKR